MGWLKRTFTEPDIRRHLLRDEGEDIVDIVRKHWVVYIIPMLIGYLALVAFAMFLFSDPDVAWLPLVIGFGLLGYATIRALAFHLDCFVITNMRVFRVHGVAGALARHDAARADPRHHRGQAAAGPDVRLRPLHLRVRGPDPGPEGDRFVAKPDERDLAIQRVVQRAGLRGDAQQQAINDTTDGVYRARRPPAGRS